MYVPINNKKIKSWQHKTSTLNKTRIPRFFIFIYTYIYTYIYEVNRNNVNRGDVNLRITVERNV